MKYVVPMIIFLTLSGFADSKWVYDECLSRNTGTYPLGGFVTSSWLQNLQTHLDKLPGTKLQDISSFLGPTRHDVSTPIGYRFQNLPHTAETLDSRTVRQRYCLLEISDSGYNFRYTRDLETVWKVNEGLTLISARFLPSAFPLLQLTTIQRENRLKAVSETIRPGMTLSEAVSRIGWPPMWDDGSWSWSNSKRFFVNTGQDYRIVHLVDYYRFVEHYSTLDKPGSFESREISRISSSGDEIETELPDECGLSRR